MAIGGPTLVRSKLALPSVAGLLHRPRVCQAIERGLESKITLVSAPAGYGKTSALVDLAQHCSVPVCWYTADERDRDLGLFVEYLVGAVGECFPGFGERTLAALGSLGSDLPRDPTGVAETLAEEMLDLDGSFALVVDNYEALDGTLGLREFAHRFLDLSPPNCHLMLGSRVLPDVPVTRLVAERQLVGLTAQDLRFAPREIRALLQQSGVEISGAQAEAVAARSEGWITGVLLLADLLRDDVELALSEVEREVGRANAETYNYLATEVLDRQPPDVQQFLLSSAVLREMSGRLCREVLQVSRPQPLLAEIERRNLFITRFGSGGAAMYRYHSLFREFLHEELHRQDASRCAELHLRAAERFEQADETEEAVHHYLAAEAHAQATALMERVAMEWFMRGRVETLLGWADALPEEVKIQAPRVLLYQSKVLTDRCDHEAAYQALAHAERGFLARGDPRLLAPVHNVRAAIAFLQDRYEDAIVGAQKALQLTSEGGERERANAQMYVGRACVRLGRLVEGVAHLQDALASFRRAGSPYNVVNALQDLSLAHITRGHLDEAAVCLNEALALARGLGAPTRIAGVLNNLGWVHYLRGEYERALALYEEGLAAARRGGDLRYQSYMLEGLADLYRDVEAYERAERLYEEAWRIAQEREPTLAVYVLAARADMCRWQGDHAQARALLGQARRLVQEKGLEFEGTGAVRAGEGILCAESGETKVGVRLLRGAVRFLEQRGARDELARARFLLAKAHLLAGDKRRAVAELGVAMDLGEEMGTHQFAAIEGQHAGDLLELGVAEGLAICRDVLAQVQELRAFLERDEDGMAEGAARRLMIYALGGGRVVRDGVPVSSSEWREAQARELFFFILLHGPLERDAIAAALWPEIGARESSGVLRKALYRIRRALDEQEAVVVEGGQYRIGDLDYWFDVEAFEGTVEQARLLPGTDWQAEELWRRAVTLYRGDLLPEVGRSWCVPRREALREKYVEALVGVGRCHEARRDFESAVDWYRRALAVDELREEVHRHIMRCYIQAGRRSDALAQYHHCQEVLRRELAMAPSAATRDVYERIAEGSSV